VGNIGTVAAPLLLLFDTIVLSVNVNHHGYLDWRILGQRSTTSRVLYTSTLSSRYFCFMTETNTNPYFLVHQLYYCLTSNAFPGWYFWESLNQSLANGMNCKLV
jgi:hypothetical protein